MAAGVILVTGLSGCGGSNSPNTPTTPPPVVPQDVTTTLPTQTFVAMSPDEARFLDVQVNVTGTLTATSDWTFSSNDLDIFVTSNTCTQFTHTGLFLGRCTTLGRAVSATAKPERLVVNVTPGVVRVWVANFGPNTESGTLQVTVTGR
jgi:hypothetical protein